MPVVSMASVVPAPFESTGMPCAAAGTARPTEQGIPMPNLYAGVQNIHGLLEWISIQDMVKATAVCLGSVESVAKSGEQTRGATTASWERR